MTANASWPSTYIKTNLFKERKENDEPHPKKAKTSGKMQVICDNHRFYWKEDNKTSKR